MVTTKVSCFCRFVSTYMAPADELLKIVLIQNTILLLECILNLYLYRKTIVKMLPSVANTVHLQTMYQMQPTVKETSLLISPPTTCRMWILRCLHHMMTFFIVTHYSNACSCRLLCLLNLFTIIICSARSSKGK